MSITGLGIDLGSRYASQLGFDGVKAHEGDSAPSIVLIEASSTGSKKKKKRRKKKEKHADKQEQTGERDYDEAESES